MRSVMLSPIYIYFMLQGRNDIITESLSDEDNSAQIVDGMLYYL